MSLVRSSVTSWHHALDRLWYKWIKAKMRQRTIETHLNGGYLLYLYGDIVHCTAKYFPSAQWRGGGWRNLYGEWRPLGQWRHRSGLEGTRKRVLWYWVWLLRVAWSERIMEVIWDYCVKRCRASQRFDFTAYVWYGPCIDLWCAIWRSRLNYDFRLNGEELRASLLHLMSSCFKHLRSIIDLNQFVKFIF